MRKIIDFFKELFGFKNNPQNLESKTSEIPITKYGLNGGLESVKSQPFSGISLVKLHLMQNKKISKKEARTLFGIASLNKIVYKLRKRGMKISYDKNTKIYTYEPKA